MGQAWSGTPPQQIGNTQGYDFLNDPLYKQASQSLQNSPNFQQFNPQQYEDYFQQGVANPAQKHYEQSVLPSITQRYSQPGFGPGSGLNKALANSSKELEQGLGSLRANYLQQGQQSHQQNQYNSILQALGLSQARANQTQPLLQEAQGGWLQDFLKTLIGTGGNIASGYAQGYAQKPK